MGRRDVIYNGITRVILHRYCPSSIHEPVVTFYIETMDGTCTEGSESKAGNNIFKADLDADPYVTLPQSIRDLTKLTKSHRRQSLSAPYETDATMLLKVHGV